MLEKETIKLLDEKIKEQARELVQDDLMQQETVTVSEAILNKMPEDARALWNSAWEKELERREGTLEENQKKYEAAIMTESINNDGEIEKDIIVATHYWKDGELHTRMTALGYDRLPPDVQEAYGKREDVVDQWIVVDKEVSEFENAFIEYAYHDNEGYSTWKEYRDAKDFGKKEEITIEKAENVEVYDKPRPTPSVEQDETLTLKK